jgi:NRPS condensation-like uncharacterized protein
MKQQKEIEWTSLEIASKLYPATWSLKDPKVFRISCELDQIVSMAHLQQALDLTIDDFPLYRCVLKRGLFWYYLEESNIQPKVSPEAKAVCAPIYMGKKSDLLFRVSFYRKRINLEVFHALADGTGALLFLQTLICHYLTIKSDDFTGIVLANEHSSLSSVRENSFDKYFIGGMRKIKKPGKPKKAYQIRGTRLSENRMQLIEGVMSTHSVLREAHKYQTTLTVFLASLFIYAIGSEMKAKKRIHPVVLAIPVNLRQYFQSVTARNFFSYINIGYRFEKHTDPLSQVIRDTEKLFKEQLTAENLNDVSNKYLAIEQNMLSRIILLPIKDLILRLASRLAKRQSTSSLSNLGIITMPPEFDGIIHSFSFCTNANRPQMNVCSYKDVLTVSISSPFRETDIQKNFFRLLSQAGISIEIAANL